jgi:hypothetical protein
MFWLRVDVWEKLATVLENSYVVQVGDLAKVEFKVR